MNQRWIGRRGFIEWPARSPDLTPCDYWFWSYVKNQVFQVDIIDREHLEARITETITAFPLHMYRNSFREFITRCELCIQNEGAHIE